MRGPAMAHRYWLDALSRTLAVACVALPPLLTACGSTSEDDAAEAAVESTTMAGLDPSSMGNAPARDSARAPSNASNTSAGTSADSRPAAAQSESPAAGAMTPGSPAAASGTAKPPAAPAPVFAACTYREGIYGR